MEIKNTWSNVSTFPYAITLQCLIRHADNSMVTFTSCFKSLTILHQQSKRWGVVNRGGDIQWFRRSQKSNVDPLKLYIVARLTTLLVNNSQNNKVRSNHSQTQVQSGTFTAPQQQGSKQSFPNASTERYLYTTPSLHLILRFAARSEIRYNWTQDSGTVARVEWKRH